MKSQKLVVFFLTSIVLFAFSQQNSGQAKQPDVSKAVQDDSPQPTENSLSARLSQSDEQQLRSLESVKKLDAHPLYMMVYHGDYDCEKPLSSSTEKKGSAEWACSLFAAMGNSDKPLYGRNFDWQHNPALLLFTDPSDGYASISMVDVSYLGYEKKDKQFDSIEGRKNLLMAPMIPFDGMNEHGLVVGMAAVPDSKQPSDDSKDSVGGLQIIRIVLDKCKNVEEAIEVFKSQNVVFNGGPNIHYLIADADGNSALIELKDEKLIIKNGDGDWDSATNFHMDGSNGKGVQLCHRYAKIQRRMNDKKGDLNVEEAFSLLKNVAQKSTRWSVVYDMKGKTANVAMSRKFSKPKAYKIKSLK